MPVVIDTGGGIPAPGSYATAADFAAYSGKAAPAGVERLLERASEAVDAAIVVGFDAIDYAIPLRLATCAIVEAWLGMNAIEPDKADFPAAGQDVSLGELSISGGGGGGGEGGPSVAAMPERARRILAVYGLLYRGVAAY